MTALTLEELLNWAFVHELPKGGGELGLCGMASAWSSINGVAELGQKIDAGQFRGDLPAVLDDGEPDPDAVVIGEAVASLARFPVDLTEDWDPVGDWSRESEQVSGLASEAVARARLRFLQKSPKARGEHVVATVIGAAILRRPPDWQMDPPKIRMVTVAGKPAWFVKRQITDTTGNVREIETDGFNRRSGRPVRGAYRKYELSPDPVGDLLSRLDWQLWVSAMRHLERILEGRITRRWIRSVRREMTPWKCGRVVHRDGLNAIA